MEAKEKLSCMVFSEPLLQIRCRDRECRFAIVLRRFEGLSRLDRASASNDPVCCPKMQDCSYLCRGRRSER